ncbi:MAG: hypothetical protein LBQ42_12535 [Synergistaceae bacterium]|jgi:DNA-directed RNA polymerase specialized sigma24 family protein|nr:hypothetical protein [Synergistaceae bacterium]
MPYPREYLWFVERVLRDYPAKLKALKEHEKTIIARCRGSSVADAHGDDVKESEPERVFEAKESNKHYQWLLRQVTRVRAGLEKLDANEREIVDLMFFNDLRKWEIVENLGLDDKTVWRRKTNALRKVAPSVIGEWVKK